MFTSTAINNWMSNISNLTTLARSAKSFLAELPTEKIAGYLPWMAKPTRWPVLAAAYSAGVVSGAGAALLFAPTSGEALRQKLWERAQATGMLDNEPLKSWFSNRVTAANTNGASDSVTKAELYEQAKEQEIPARSTMSKKELADALRENIASE